MKEIIKFLKFSKEEFYKPNLEIFPSVFYIGFGKTGSQSICAGFANNKVAHWHSEKFVEKLYGISLNNNTLLDIVDYTKTKSNIVPLVIECVREPISRALSVIFQEFHTKRISKTKSSDEAFVKEWVSGHINKKIIPYSLNWKSHYGIDILSAPIKDKKYFYTEIPNVVKLLYLRYENIKMSNTIINSIGYNFSLQHYNKTSYRHTYSDLYNTYKNTFKFDKNFLIQAYDQDWIKSTYSQEEINELIKKHSL
jgi:hypothetical protein